MIRTFIAIPVDCTPALEEIRQRISGELAAFPIKWSSPGNFHITLAFLGNTDEKIIAQLINKTESMLKSFHPFTIRIAGAGSFHGKAIWLGTEHCETLMQMRTAVAEALNLFGYSIDTKIFFPHMTLGQPKFANNERQIGKHTGRLVGRRQLDH